MYNFRIMNRFTAPKKFSPFYSVRRIPRKKKKQLKPLLNKYSFLTLNEKLWYILGETNKEYRDFLIQKICKDERY